jgi:16S rRNA (cytosine967-C5)-methyltransferase
VSPARRCAIAGLGLQQQAILAAAGRATKPGGTVTWSVCTISRSEGEDQMERFIHEQPGFRLEEQFQLLPHRDGADGFFIARLRRESH